MCVGPFATIEQRDKALASLNKTNIAYKLFREKDRVLYPITSNLYPFTETDINTWNDRLQTTEHPGFHCILGEKKAIFVLQQWHQITSSSAHIICKVLISGVQEIGTITEMAWKINNKANGVLVNSFFILKRLYIMKPGLGMVEKIQTKRQKHDKTQH